MSSPAYKVHEGTAASLLQYKEYTKNKPDGTTEKSWTRYASADQEFNIVAVGGRKLLIKFDKNFSKKHLATFSKKEGKLAAEVAALGKLDANKGKSAEELQKIAQENLLKAKMLKTLGIRSGSSAEVNCSACGHPRKNDPDGSGHSNSGNCRVSGCTCTGYVSGYVTSRTTEGKPDTDPLAGAKASTSSCIVLNWIPKNEFETVVGNSILKVDPKNELANTPTTGSPAPLDHLKWDFGSSRAGAVRVATNGAVTVNNGTWCEVGAQKVKGGPTGIDATWTIVHWQGQG